MSKEIREQINKVKNWKQFLNESVNYDNIINIIFNENDKIKQIGTKIQYREYVKSIFPNSKIKDIVFHETSGNWYYTDDFKLDNIGKTDDGYYGKGFYFSTTEGLGTYGEKTIFVKLNISKLKTNVNTHDVGKIILMSFNKNESKKLAVEWLDKNIEYIKNELNNLKKGIIFKHKDIPKGVDYEKYWVDKINMSIKNKNVLMNDFLIQKKDIDNLINYYYSFDGFSTDDDLENYSEIFVRNPNNIHILGSNKDLTNFNNFLQ